MAAITYTSLTSLNSTSPTNTTYSSWDNQEEEEWTTYTGTVSKPIEEFKSKWHTFCYWLNYLLDPPEDPVLPPEKPPPKKPKFLKYFNVKLARAPPLAFFV